jgi:hypothetical protein
MQRHRAALLTVARGPIAMTRVGAKATLLALSLAAMLGGWATIAAREWTAALASSGRGPATTALARPGFAPRSPAQGEPAAGPTLTPPAANGPTAPLRPLARTRSSR